MSHQLSCKLVADVGGTNTRVALVESGSVIEATVERFRNDEFPNLESVLAHYVSARVEKDVESAAVAIAGPVRDGHGELTNLDWEFDQTKLKECTGAKRAAVLNDLQAQGYALSRVKKEDLRTVIKGPKTDGTKLVIGIGTGFNVAPVFDTPAGPYVPPSEAGHVNLPVRHEEESQLSKFVEKAHGFPAVEDVLSGRGLERVYAWHASQYHQDPPALNGEEIMKACANGDQAAVQAVRIFAKFLGTESGNLALLFLPFGGIYLIGGVTRAIAPYLNSVFSDAFRDKGRFADFMDEFSIEIVEDDFAALTGLAVYLEI